MKAGDCLASRGHKGESWDNEGVGGSTSNEGKFGVAIRLHLVRLVVSTAYHQKQAKQGEREQGVDCYNATPGSSL